MKKWLLECAEGWGWGGGGRAECSAQIKAANVHGVNPLDVILRPSDWIFSAAHLLGGHRENSSRVSGPHNEISLHFWKSPKMSSLH